MGFSFDSIVFPFSLKKRYSVASLIDPDSLDSDVSFIGLKNKKNRGQFYLGRQSVERRELRRIPVADLDNVFYKPLFPEGARSTSSLPVESVNGQVVNVDPFGAEVSRLFADDLIDKVTFFGYRAEDRDKSKSKFITRRDWLPDVVAEKVDFLANRAGEAMPLSELVRFYDFDGQKVKKFIVSDLDSGASSGYLRLDGVDYNGRSLDILGHKKLSKIQYIVGDPGTSNRISISAGSKSGFGDEKILSLNTLSNAKPSVEIDDNEFSRQSIGEAIDINRLIKVNDPEGKDLAIQIAVDSDSPFPGFLVAGDQRVPLGEAYETTLSQLSSLEFQVGRPGAISDVHVKVFDEEHLEEKTVRWTTIPNSAPATVLENATFAASTAGQEQSVAGYFNYSDPEGDRIREVGFVAQGGGGYFVRKGNQYRNKIVYFPYEELAEVRYVPGPQSSSTRVGIAVRDEWGDEQIEFADWSVSSQDDSDSTSAFDLYNRINPGTLPSFDVLTSVGYVPDSRLARQFLDAFEEGYSQSFSLGVNKSWNLGEILGVPNQKDYSFFIGPDRSFSWSGDDGGFSAWGLGSLSYAYGTGENIFRAGLQVDGGFGLGSIDLQGGVNSRLDYSPGFGITLSSSPVTASLDVTYPYAYLDVDAEARLKFSPYLNASGCLLGYCDSTGNLLSWANIDVGFDESLVDLDTRDITGDSYRQSFSWGPFSTTARIPRFSGSGVLDEVPSAFTSDRLWGSDSSGAGVAYGISGSASLFEFSASLGQLITDLFGIPLTDSISGSFGPISASGSFTIADANINASTDLNYQLSAAYKNNFYVQIEGAGDLMPIWDPAQELTLRNFEDLNDDGFVEVSIHSDPIIGVQAKVDLDSNLGASYEFLKASGSVGISRVGRQSLGFGPIYSDSFDLGSLGSVNLFDQSKMWRLSDLAPDIQSQLVATVNVPLV